MQHRPKARGVSTVEFVVIFPIALLVVLCLIQWGFLSMGKLTLNHATFMAARHGAMKNGRLSEIRSALIENLLPFYQDATNTNDPLRIKRAWLKAQTSTVLDRPEVYRISPNDRTLADFGVEINGQRHIPHDNLQWRNTAVGPSSGVNIQDANLLKIRVVYGYELKVPLMGTLIKTVMCGGSTAVDAWGGAVPVWRGLDLTNCPRYYARHRVPIESYAVVEMQSAFSAP